MSSQVIPLIVFAVIFGGAMLGIFLKSILPESQLSPESKDVVKLSIGLIATMTALILGLLAGSVKSSFDSKNDSTIGSVPISFCSTANWRSSVRKRRLCERLKLGATARSEQVTGRYVRDQE